VVSLENLPPPAEIKALAQGLARPSGKLILQPGRILFAGRGSLEEIPEMVSKRWACSQN